MAGGGVGEAAAIEGAKAAAAANSAAAAGTGLSAGAGLAATAPAFAGAGLSAGAGLAGAEALGSGLALGGGLGAGSLGAGTLGGMEVLGGLGSGLAFTAPAAAAAAPGMFSSLASALGMTPTQLAVQGGLQAGSLGLQSIGAAQQQAAREAAMRQYNDRFAATSAQQQQLFGDNVAQHWGEFAADQSSALDDWLKQYTAGAQNFSGASAGAPESTPDVVKADLSRRTQAADDFNFGKAKAAGDMASLGSLLSGKALATHEANTKIGNLAKVNQAAAGDLTTGLTLAGAKGQTEMAGGNLLSGIGNLMLASKLSKA